MKQASVPFLTKPSGRMLLRCWLSSMKAKVLSFHFRKFHKLLWSSTLRLKKKGCAASYADEESREQLSRVSGGLKWQSPIISVANLLEETLTKTPHPGQAP